MWLPVFLAALGMGEVGTPYREVVVAESCAAWFAERGVQPPSAVHRVDDDGLCFVGSTTDEGSAAFVQAVAAIDPATPLVFVVRSDGGEINAALAMAEALIPRETTVVVQRSCFSSCANYLFLAGDRRVILPGGLLLYHGGSFEQPESYWVALREEWSRTMNARDLEASMTASRAYATDSLARQDAFLKSVGVDADLFDWMQDFNTLTDDERLAMCPVVDPVVFAYSDAVLADRNIVIHANGGPKSQAELSEAFQGRGSAGAACYWD